MSFNNTKTPNKPTGKAKWQVPMRPHPGMSVKEYYLDGELKERFCQLFPKNSNRRLMKWFGISFSTLQRFRRELGLQKDMRAIRKQLAKDIKKTCEKNGYYDSLRGHAPSLACQEATRKLRAEGFNPWKQLKANNPRKYKRARQKSAEQHKEIIRKERMRMVYGLERRTKLRLPLNSLSHKASACKYMMIRQCNYFADPDGDSHIICYDSQTRRSEKREATAIRHGFTIVEGED